MMAAATAMAINRSVARIGDIPFLEVNFLIKAFSSFDKGLVETDVFNLYELRIYIVKTKREESIIGGGLV
jgi:hypothetical protein